MNNKFSAGKQLSMILLLSLLFMPNLILINDAGGFLNYCVAQPIDNESKYEKKDIKKRGRVKIAAIGASPFNIAPNSSTEMIVNEAIVHWRNKINQVLPDRPDLIVVPEVCDRPAGYPREQQIAYYQARKDKVLKFFIEVAKKNHCYIVYPAVRGMADGTWRNSCTFIGREGEIIGYYNKNHMVIEETTVNGILCGRDAPLFECDFGRVAFAICFDLNFEELRLKYVEQKPDLIVFPSMYHGGLMQAYWAYSCRSYFVAAVAGEVSEIRNPLGEVVSSSTNYFDYTVAEVNLDFRLVHLDYNWKRLQALKEKYGPQVTITDPGYLGAVMITSEHPRISVDEMIEEFNIELLDDYMTRALKHRHAPGNIE
jgi:predicted amidohydrolase